MRSEVNWSGVREQVLALREAPFPEKVFGARRHGFGHDFLLESPLGESEVEAAEEELGVALPATYRTFLLEVGAGERPVLRDFSPPTRRTRMALGRGQRASQRQLSLGPGIPIRGRTIPLDRGVGRPRARRAGLPGSAVISRRVPILGRRVGENRHLDDRWGDMSQS